MNERIDEIAKEARDYAGGYWDEYSRAWFQFYNEKFAELIVRECVDHIKDRVLGSFGEGDYFEGYMDGARESCRLIKERFGVE